MHIENIEEFFHNSITDHSADYTAESIASALIKKNIPHDQIIFKPKGTYRRSYQKDVCAICSTFNEYTNNTLYFLESPREGIYDTLPESIFHSFSTIKSSNNTASIKEEMKKHREEEQAARLFFLPFEQEFFNIKRSLFEFEDQFDWLSHTSSIVEIYNNYYPVLNDLSIEKGYLFLRLIPLIHEIRDDFPKIEQCLHLLLDVEVEILLSFKKKAAINTYTSPELGFATLGQNTIIGTVIEDGEPDLSVVLKPIHCKDVHDYSFFQKKLHLTEQLCDYFIGAHYEVSISYALEGMDHPRTLNAPVLLGYTVYL